MSYGVSGSILRLARWSYPLAVVQADRAVGPTVVVDQTQVGEEADAHCLQTSLVAECEAITLDLQKSKRQVRD